MRIRLLPIIVALVVLSFETTNRVSAQAPTSGLVAHYTFDGSYTDQTGSGLEATPVNADNISFTFSPSFGRSVLSLSGEGFTEPTGGYVVIPRPLGLGSTATISFAVLEKGYSHHHGQGPISFQDGGLTPQFLGYNWFIGDTGGATPGFYGDAAEPDGVSTLISEDLPAFTYDSITDAITIDAPAWISYQIVTDAGLMDIYRNGDFVAQIAAALPSEGDFYLNFMEWGGQYAGSATRLTADYADVRVYDRPLDSTEVQQLAAAVPEPSTYALLLCAGLSSFWLLKRRRS